MKRILASAGAVLVIIVAAQGCSSGSSGSSDCPVGQGPGCCDGCGSSCPACIFVACPTTTLLACICQAEVCGDVCTYECAGQGFADSGPCLDCAEKAQMSQCIDMQGGTCLDYGA